MKSKELFARIKSIFPPLDDDLKKGQNGKVGVIGGSYEYSGPPYYSGVSSLKVGADMVHVFCPKSSATAIKSYSPELIVHPVFDIEQDAEFTQEQLEKVLQGWLDIIKKWQKDIYSWVIGPGLGQDKYISKFFPRLVRNLHKNSVIVFDADGVFYLCQNPQLFKQLSKYRAVITPNKTQLACIQKSLNIDIYSKIQKFLQTEEYLCQFQYEWKQPFTIIMKGNKDVILGRKNFIMAVKGSPKRTANIGDILAGTVATCCEWDYAYGTALATLIVRLATKGAFQKQGRSITALDIIAQIAPTIQALEIQPPYFD